MRWFAPATRSRSDGLAAREACPLPELTGPSLRLRGLQLGDAPRILALLRDVEVSRFFLWEPPRDLAEAREYVQSFQDEVALRWAYHFAVVRQQDRALLGVANLYHIDVAAGEAEIGIWLGQAYWGQGLQQEVSRLLLAFGFETLGLDRLLFRVAVQNGRARTAFCKLGVTERGRVLLFSRRQDRMVEHLVYGMEAGEWGQEGRREERAADDARGEDSG
jgi:ribosomal-protein-alanine N-acetyltransferase